MCGRRDPGHLTYYFLETDTHSAPRQDVSNHTHDVIFVLVGMARTSEVITCGGAHCMRRIVNTAIRHILYIDDIRCPNIDGSPYFVDADEEGVGAALPLQGGVRYLWSMCRYVSVWHLRACAACW